VADVFISYSQQSANSAEALAKALAAEGLDVWWDTRLTAGQRFDDVIRGELEQADAAIVIWSHASIISSYVKMEAGFAYGLDKLITVRTPDLAPEDIPEPFRSFHTSPVTDIQQIIAALGGKGVQPRSARQRKRMNEDEFFASLAGIDPGLPCRLREWVQRCQAAGFRPVMSRSLMLKAGVPTLGDVNFGTIFPDGALQTNYISASAERIGDTSIATDYLDGIAGLLEGASIRKEGAPWTWRVELYGALPPVSKVLARGHEWLELMQTAKRRFVEAASNAGRTAS
jgi:hypothetical protein